MMLLFIDLHKTYKIYVRFKLLAQKYLIIVWKRIKNVNYMQ
jgi:hypothetical protein